MKVDEQNVENILLKLFKMKSTYTVYFSPPMVKQTREQNTLVQMVLIKGGGVG